MHSPFGNNYYALTLIALAGVSLYVSLEHLIISLRRRDLRYEPWIVVMGLCFAGLALTHYVAIGKFSEDFVTLYQALWFGELFQNALILGVAGFIASITAMHSKWGWYGFIAVFLITSILHFVLPYGFLVERYGSIYRTALPWGETITQIEEQFLPSYFPYIAYVLLLFLWGGYRGVGMWLQGKKRHGGILVACLAAAVVATILSVIDEQGWVDLTVDPIVPTLLCVLLIINYLLADELASAPVLSQRAEASESKNAQLLSSLDQKKHEVDTLLAVISLDLRTPLVNVLGFSEDLHENLVHSEAFLETTIPDEPARKQVAECVREQLLPSLDFVRQGARRLHQMLDAVQLVSRLDRSILKPEICSVADTLKQVIDDMAPALRDCNAQVKIKELPDCLADRSLLSQAFFHLLDNAIKFRSPRRSLQIAITEKAHPLPEFARWKIIGISDNGSGFEPSRANQLFELFHREQLAPSTESMGIGLYLARRALWRMQGDLWAEGTLDEGATFWVALPPARELPL